MRRRAVLVLLLGAMLAAAVLAVACGLDVEGSGPPTPDAAGQDGTIWEAMLPPDGQVLDALTEAAQLPPALAGGDAGEPALDASADAVAVGDCGSPIITDDFNTPTIGTEWITYGNAVAASSKGNGYVSLTPVGQGSKVGGIFTKLTAHATSFVASFRYYAQSPRSQNGPVGDGFTMAWISAANVTAAALGNAISGGGLGVSNGASGVAFALDAYTNANLNDPSTPSFSLLQLDGTRMPGSYDWHVKSVGPYRGVYDGWRTVTITVDHGKVTASVDGTPLFQQTMVSSANIDAIGFSAATGGVGSIGFNVDTVSIQLTDPTCP